MFPTCLIAESGNVHSNTAGNTVCVPVGGH